ncbi:MAG: putative cupin superfamily sugar epimerase [Oceanicoccus sp.]|jgi:predicted cupin superfamily sugar epimerase
MNKQQLIASLQLEPHMEGGYFRRSYVAERSVSHSNGQHRPLLSSIYYMLTDDSPVGYFHSNQSDIMHYWHSGSSLRYFLINPHGEYSSVCLGPDLEHGQQLQLLVPGGYWKATRLEQGEYGLLSEAVSPGFDYADMTLATTEQLQATFPALWLDPIVDLAPLCQS